MQRWRPFWCTRRPNLPSGWSSRASCAPSSIVNCTAPIIKRPNWSWPCTTTPGRSNSPVATFGSRPAAPSDSSRFSAARYFKAPHSHRVFFSSWSTTGHVRPTCKTSCRGWKSQMSLSKTFTRVCEASAPRQFGTRIARWAGNTREFKLASSAWAQRRKMGIWNKWVCLIFQFIRVKKFI